MERDDGFWSEQKRLGEISDMPENIWAKRGYSDCGDGMWDEAEMGEDIHYTRTDTIPDRVQKIQGISLGENLRGRIWESEAVALVNAVIDGQMQVIHGESVALKDVDDLKAVSVPQEVLEQVDKTFSRYLNGTETALTMISAKKALTDLQKYTKGGA